MFFSYGRQSITTVDINAVIQVLKSDWLTQGPKVAEFEAALCKYTGAKYAVAVSNGTAALHLACLAADIKPGDTGITSSLTFVASANCIEYCGGKAVLVEIDADTGLIDIDQIEKAITSKTKVIIPVHYAGQSCDMQAIANIAKRHKLTVIEDAAHAIGSEYRGHKVGSCHYSDMTIFSFHPVKTITTAEGGAVMTNNKPLYQKLITLRTHGITKDSKSFEDQSGRHQPWYYEMQTLGFNYRLTELQATLGLSQLRRLDRFVAKRQKIINWYHEFFEDVPNVCFIRQQRKDITAWHLLPLLIDFSQIKITKTQLFNCLKQKNISVQVHYIPIYLHPYYSRQKSVNCQTRPSCQFYHSEVSLPLYPDLNKSQVKYISHELISLLS